MYALDLVDRLDAIVRGARRLPVVRRARVDTEAAYEVLDELRAELGGSPAAVLDVVDAIDDVLFDDGLVDRERLLALISELRSRLANSAHE